MRFVGVGDREETWLPSSYGGPDGPPGPVRGDSRGTARRSGRRADAGASGNARLTAANAAVLLVLLAAEGVTVLRVRQLLSPHVFIGMVLIPPVLLKVASAASAVRPLLHRRAGLSAHGPTASAAASVRPGGGDFDRGAVGERRRALGRPALAAALLKVHKASFVLWFGAMTVHVLGHLVEVVRLAPRDWVCRTQREVAGAGARQWPLAASLVAGVVLGFLLLGHVGHWEGYR